MYENFASLHTIDTDRARMGKPRQYMTSMFQPNYYGGAPWAAYIPPIVIAEEYTGWRDESLATHLTCAIATNLNPMPIVRYSGADARAFLQYNMVNNFDKFEIGQSKHGIICEESGNISVSGVIIRIAEDAYETFGFPPVLMFRYQEQAERFPNVTFDDFMGKRFVFQLMGPKTLEILENACEQDLHGLGFCRKTSAQICGHPVEILRFGMHGGLGYEVHGDAEFAQEIHKRIIEVGNPYGIRLLGFRAYILSHTPGCSQQFGLHYGLEETIDYMSMLSQGNEDADMLTQSFPGSASGRKDLLTRNPFELGLGYVVDFNHDFIGKAALEAYRDNPKRTLVTLEWNKDDIIEVFASQFDPEGEPYQQFDHPGQMNVRENSMQSELDLVFDAEGNEIGVSGGRSMSPFHRAMLSLATIDLTFKEPGTEVYVLWGNPTSHQKKIRAKVVETPYNRHCMNRTFDTDQIPRYAG